LIFAFNLEKYRCKKGEKWHLKLIAKINLNIESSTLMLPILSFIQRIGITEAILEAIGLKEGKSSKNQVFIFFIRIQ